MSVLSCSWGSSAVHIQLRCPPQNEPPLPSLERGSVGLQGPCREGTLGSRSIWLCSDQENVL